MEKGFILLISVMLIIDFLIFIKTCKEKKNIQKLEEELKKELEEYVKIKNNK